MKRFSIPVAGLLCLSVMLASPVSNEQLKQVNAVYILSMGNGIDQFLANQLTNAGVLQVVTDPKRADAILTDHLGESFEKKLDDLYPPPPTPEQLQKEAEEKEKAKSRGLDLGAGGAIRAPGSSFGSAKGNFFLVDRKTRHVLWSVYEPLKDTGSDSLTKVATRVVKRLQADLSGKKPE